MSTWSQTLQLVDAAISRVQPELPATAVIQTHRLTFASFPIIGYSLTSDTVPQTKLWDDGHLRIEAAAEPPGRRGDRGRSGRTGAGVPHHARSRQAAGDGRHGHRHSGRGAPHQSDRLARAARAQSSALSGLVNGQVHDPEQIAADRDQDDAGGNSGAHRRRRQRRARREARLHHRHCERTSPPCCSTSTASPTATRCRLRNEVHDEIERIRQTLPPGIQMQPFYDQSTS